MVTTQTWRPGSKRCPVALYRRKNSEFYGRRGISDDVEKVFLDLQ